MAPIMGLLGKIMTGGPPTKPVGPGPAKPKATNTMLTSDPSELQALTLQTGSSGPGGGGGLDPETLQALMRYSQA